MYETKRKILKEFEEKFLISGDFLIRAYPYDVKEFLFKALDSMREETAEGICKLIDKIELSYRDTSLEEWKAFKHIRNAIRDKYFKTKNE